MPEQPVTHDDPALEAREQAVQGEVDRLCGFHEQHTLEPADIADSATTIASHFNNSVYDARLYLRRRLGALGILPNHDS